MSVAVIDRNDVVLRGRLSAPAEVRTLPSGDTLVSFRLVVRRPEPRVRGQSTDTLPCITYDRALQRRGTAWRPGGVGGGRWGERRGGGKGRSRGWARHLKKKKLVCT